MFDCRWGLFFRRHRWILLYSSQNIIGTHSQFFNVLIKHTEIYTIEYHLYLATYWTTKHARPNIALFPKRKQNLAQMQCETALSRNDTGGLIVCGLFQTPRSKNSRPVVF
jgi:hypothetical protein